MKRKLYGLHRRLSIIIALPVLLWASSGLMHPIMTNIRPAVATQIYKPAAVDPGRVRVPLDSALRRRHLDSIAAVRLVHIDTNWFYQVRPAQAGATPLYLSCTNGKLLPQGDWLYAQYLARYFLEGDATPGSPAAQSDPDHDCCGAATQCVLHPARGAAVSNVSLLGAFNDEYKSINRLLPVYRVDFDRPDGIRIYVETTQDRFSFAMDHKRAAFDTFFRLCHTWGWLDGLGRARLVVEVAIALLAFFTALLGIYLFFALRRKTRGIRRVHRGLSLFAVLFTLLWSFSGGYHALVKLATREEPVIPRVPFAVSSLLHPDWQRLQAVAGPSITDVRLARIDGRVFWRVSLLGAPVRYVSAGDYQLLPDGDRQYALSLAARYMDKPTTTAALLTAFDDEYNFSDKRLPVWRVNSSGPQHERVYVETCSGELAARMNDALYAEGYSFSVFHKHHFMDWGGKKVRDASTLFWAAMQILLVAVGLGFFIVSFRRRPRASYNR
jgi:hypothetical protein